MNDEVYKNFGAYVCKRLFEEKKMIKSYIEQSDEVISNEYKAILYLIDDIYDLIDAHDSIPSLKKIIELNLVLNVLRGGPNEDIIDRVYKFYLGLIEEFNKEWA